MEIVQAVLAMIAACIGFALIARHLNLPYAVILVLGGMGIAFIPGLPDVTLDPELALAFFLPPLLMASAWRTDWRAFRANIRPILFLAVGAVLFTAICVAVVAKLLIPGLPWAAAVALGAIVAPPDAVAAAAVLGRLPIPRRVVTVLEGESLVNDASALVLYRFAIAAVAAGGIAFEQAVGTFVLVAAGAVLVGWLVGLAADWVFRRLEDTLLEIAASFVACFASFFASEALHLSGVIGVVTTGLVLGQLQHRSLTPESRISAAAVWGFTEFVMTSLVFILVGLQLRGILVRMADYSIPQLAGLAAAISATLIVSRFLWVFPSGLIPRVMPGGAMPGGAISGPRDAARTPPIGHLAVISWAGMRGVVSLAAALALPLDFPERDLLIFLAFCAILATLVVQGTTLEWVIRRLNVAEPRVSGMPREEAEARRHIARATLAEIEARADDILEGAVARDLLPEYQEKSRVYHGVAEGGSNAELEARMRIRLGALRSGRKALLDQHRQGAFNDMMLASLEHELDLEEIRILRLLGAVPHR